MTRPYRKSFFAKQLYVHRTKKGLSQLQLAKLLRCSEKSISLYEKGIMLPKWDLIEEIGKVLGMNLNEFKNYYNTSANTICRKDSNVL